MRVVFYSLLIFMVLAGTIGTAHSADFMVTAVVREFPMKSGETLYKDFYINAGSNNGLRKGAYIEAMRKMAAFDNVNSKLAGDTQVKIARLQIIHIDKNLSIARLVKFYEKDKNPIAGFDTVMIGDVIQVAEAQ